MKFQVDTEVIDSDGSGFHVDSEVVDSTGGGDAAYDLCGEFSKDAILRALGRILDSKQWLTNAEGDETLSIHIKRKERKTVSQVIWEDHDWYFAESNEEGDAWFDTYADTDEGKLMLNYYRRFKPTLSMLNQERDAVDLTRMVVDYLRAAMNELAKKDSAIESLNRLTKQVDTGVNHQGLTNVEDIARIRTALEGK